VPPRELPSVEDLEAVTRAALAAHDEFQRQARGGFIDRDRLLEVMMPANVDAALAILRDQRTRNRRYVPGSVDERKVVRIAPTPDRSVLQVLMCWRNNDAEYDTKGTDSLGDDVLIQDRLEVVGFRRQMRLVNGAWKLEVTWRETGLCAAS
jgi:hypothetical protein